MLQLLILILISGLLVLLYLLPIRVKVDFKRQKEKDNADLEIESYFFNHQLELSYLDIKGILYPFFIVKGQMAGLIDEELLISEELEEEEIEELLKFLNHLQGIVEQIEPISFFSDHCTYLFWQTDFGLQKPALTGIASGALWGIKGAIVAGLRNYFKFSTQPIINVEPNFDEAKPLSVKFKGIFKFRLGNIILMGGKVAFYELKRRLKYG
ncbi:DUF2953 domain-containing protein [Halanaerocella petrolearia]